MKIGRQEPTFSVIGKYDSSIGPEVVEMFEEDGGATFYQSQKQELELMLARNNDGSPSALTIGISKPRQNGKSYAARFYAVYMSDFEHRDVLYSAHHSSTTHKMFKALCDLFESPERFPDFASDVKHISHVRGYEGIYFKDFVDSKGNTQKGGCIEFATRTNSGSRGGTYSVIIIDEAQELTNEQLEGMLPVISAASDVNDKKMMPQQILIGTPPGPACHGTIFKNMHDSAHNGESPDTWWLEWSVEGDLDKLNIDAKSSIEYAYDTNPAMGHRIAEKTIVNEYENMSADGFARERLGWWAPKHVQRIDLALNKSNWTSCSSDLMKPEGKTAYGVKFSADGSIVSLAGAVQGDDGVIRISLIEQKPTGQGTQWLADWLNARYKKACCVVIDGRNGVDVLIDKLGGTWIAKNSVIRPGIKDILAAVGMLVDAVNEKTLTWYSKQEILNDSAITSVKRPLGGGWGFGGDNSTPIEACSLALWAVKTSKRNPSKLMRIG